MSNYAADLFDGHFAGKSVVVMGGAQGIGKTIAAAFAAAGASVVVTDQKPSITETAAELRAAGLDVTGMTCDVTNDEEVKGVFAKVKELWGKLDVLVNNAGIIEINELENTATASFTRVMQVNTVAQFIAAREALPLFEAAGGGTIVNAASGQAREGFIYTPSYAASKMGVVGLTQSLAKELAAKNITVNAYCPGIVATEMWAYNDAEWGKRLGDYKPGELMQEWIDDIPIGRAATEADVANAILFLASEAGNYITGQALNVDGGMFMN
ncbi:MAG: SDR family oxidoreductase [Actinomycetaceae bacterium]|nr:SDR family oxidoreductase [Actinomycetaceae bacterium]